MTRPTDDQVRDAFRLIEGVATVSSAGAAAALRCSPPTARRWAGVIGIRPRPRTAKKGPHSNRLAPHRRRGLVKRLESIHLRLLNIQTEINGTPDGAPIATDDPAERAGYWIVRARMKIVVAMDALESDPPE